MRGLLALMRKELAVLFGSPMAYLVLALVGLVTALLFFDHLRVYNQILFVYTSSASGGFELGTVPEGQRRFFSRVCSRPRRSCVASSRPPSAS